MDFPAVINQSESDLPQVESLWKKIKYDLGQGFKVISRQTHTNHIVRTYTKHEALGWQFLIVASANETMPPVFGVELHFYPPGVTTWKLDLKYQPLSQPHWQHTWHVLKNMHEIDEQVSINKQGEIISAYLSSEFDKETTASAYKRVGYGEEAAKWILG